MKNIIITLISLTIFGISGYTVISRPETAVIRAHVDLSIGCEIEPRYFVIAETKTGKYYHVVNSKAEFDIQQGTSLQVTLHPRFVDVVYYGPTFAARKHQNIYANCKNAEDLFGVFKAMN